LKSKAFIQKVRRYAKRRGLVFAFDARKGKGSHGCLYLGERLTTVKFGSISPGLVHKMLKDLNIDTKDF
jgi:mRNA interferase HicA